MGRVIAAIAIVFALTVEVTPQAIAQTTYTVTTSNATGPGSLGEAIDNANNNAGADIITFSSGFTIDANNVSTSDFDFDEIEESVTIDGDINDDGFADVTITDPDGSSNLSVFAVRSGLVTIEGVIFDSFDTSNDGTAIEILNAAPSGTTVNVTACEFRNLTNTDETGATGGAIYGNEDNVVNIDRSIFTNVTQNGSGAVVGMNQNTDITITNSLFYENTAGVGIVEGFGSNGRITLRNVTSADNSAPTDVSLASGASAEVYNSILDFGTSVTGSNNIQDGASLFTDAANDDYTLVSGASSVIDQGDNNQDSGSLDLSGGARVVNGTVDIGAYERGTAPSASAPSVATATPSGITPNAATLGGEVTANGGATVTDRGVVYSPTDTDPRIGDAGVTQNTNGSGTGVFSETSSGLSANTTYYVNAYATNSEGTSYGSVESFTTGNTAPVFTTTTSSESVAENSTGVVFDFDANDGDSGADDTSVSYSLSGPDAAPFSIDASTGTLTLDIGLDFENPSDGDANNDYELTVTATDSELNNNTTTQSVTVNVTNVNDAPTISDISDQTIAEDATLGPVSFTVSDPDEAASALTVSASSDNQTLVPDANITLGGSGSNRTIEATPAANENGTATITVEVTDGGSLSATDVFTLTVTAVNDPPTLALSTTTPSLAEGNATPTTVATITVTDDNEAGSNNTLSLSGTDSGSFQINGSDLEFTEVADAETKSSYSVTVNVDDPNVGADPDDSEAVTLTITNVNEAPTATTGAASSITTTAATLNGTASTGGGPDATVTFIYFPTATPANTTTVTADQSPVSSDAPVSVSANISGLVPNTEYGFRVNANNTEGNAIGSDVTFTTSGAPAITVTDGANPLPNGSGTFDFGTVDGVDSSPEQTFTIENNGSTDLAVTNTTLSNTTDFTLTQTPSSTVAAGASTDFAVQFTTATPGTYTTTVSIDNSDADETPYTFTIEATAGTPEADVFVETSPRTPLSDGGTFDFGTVTAGASSTETFTIENNGDATLSISPPSSIPGAFNVTAIGGSAPPLAPGEAFTFDVTFTPSGATAFSESFSVTNNDPDENPYDVTLTGTGAARELTITDGSVDGLDFDASVAPGTDNNAVGIVALSANAGGTTLEGLTITSNAPGIEGLSAARLFGSDDATLNTGSDTELASMTTNNTSAPATIAFGGFSDPIPTSTRYLILAIDVDAGAPASDVQFFLDQPSDLTINGDVAIATVNGQSETTFAALPLSNGATALPVEMTTFSGTAHTTNTTETVAEQRVDLQWETASETNNAGFEVQRRADSTAAWTALGFVEGAGTTDEAQTYRFRDPNVPFATEQLTYRLRQVDTDGTESFSAPFVMDVPMPQAATLQAPFPNPTQGAITLRYTLAEPADVQLQVYDLLGRRVTTLTRTQVEAGRHELHTSVRDLAAGTYFVRMVAGGTVETQRLTIVR